MSFPSSAQLWCVLSQTPLRHRTEGLSARPDQDLTRDESRHLQCPKLLLTIASLKVGNYVQIFMIFYGDSSHGQQQNCEIPKQMKARSQNSNNSTHLYTSVICPSRRHEKLFWNHGWTTEMILTNSFEPGWSPAPAWPGTCLGLKEIVVSPNGNPVVKLLKFISALDTANWKGGPMTATSVPVAPSKVQFCPVSCFCASCASTCQRGQRWEVAGKIPGRQN